MRRLVALLTLLTALSLGSRAAHAQPGGTLPQEIRTLVAAGGGRLGMAIRSEGSLVAALQSGSLAGDAEVAAFMRAAQARQVPGAVLQQYPELRAALRDLRNPSNDLREAMAAFLAVEQAPTGAFARLTANCNVGNSPSLQRLADAVFKVAGRSPPPNYTPVPQPPPGVAVFVNLNVENLFAFRPRALRRNSPDYLPRNEAEYKKKLHKIALGLVNEAHGPDFIGLEEISNADDMIGGVLYGQRAPGHDGLPDVLADLVEEIRIVSGGTLRYVAYADETGADGRGILQGMLVREDSVRLIPAEANHPVLGSRPNDPNLATFPRNGEVANPKAVNGMAPQASRNDGRGEALFGRPPLVSHIEITKDGFTKRVYTIVDHFKSRADQFVPRRTAQGDFSGGLAEEILDVEPDALLIDMGDKNTPYLQQLAGLTARLRLANARLPEAEQYSFNFRGEPSELDYGFLSPEADRRLIYVQSVHLNSQATNAHRASASSPFGAGDHDPQVYWLYLGDGTIPPFRQFVPNTPQ